jgi:plastocyanin
MVEPVAAPIDSLVLPILIVVSLAIQARRSIRIRRRPRLKPIFLAMLSGSLLALGGQQQALSQTQTTQVRITDTGFQPASIAINPGDSVHWTSEATGPHTVTATNGAFDSGQLPPGAGFSVMLATPGTYTYRSAANAAFTGTVRVQALGLTGPPTALAIDHVPDIASPDSSAADVSVHPTLAMPVSRTRILVELSPTATVAQVNAALAAAQVGILGGQPSLNWLTVGADDTPDLSALTAALQSLRSSSAIVNASLSPQVQFSSVPSFTLPAGWSWKPTFTGAGAPFGDGANWGFTASRFPQIWNLAESTRKLNPQVDIAMIDGGISAREDVLPSLRIRDDICAPALLGASKCSRNVVQNDHANMVAGIIQMGDAALGRGQLHSVSLANFLRNTSQIGGSAQLFDESMELFSYTLQEVRPGGKLPNVRVINYSAAAGGVSQPDGTLRQNATGQDLWWLARPAPTCGGAMCTPNNDDEWQREFGAVGRHAERIADVAATKKVLIVQAAGQRWLRVLHAPESHGLHGQPLHVRAHPRPQRGRVRLGSAQQSRPTCSDRRGARRQRDDKARAVAGHVCRLE